MKKYIVIFISFVIALSGCEGPRYKKLIMQTPDGKKKVFVGESVWTLNDGGVTYRTKDRKLHTFTGPHWIEPMTDKEFEDFKPPAEAE